MLRWVALFQIALGTIAVTVAVLERLCGDTPRAQFDLGLGCFALLHALCIFALEERMR